MPCLQEVGLETACDIEMPPFLINERKLRSFDETVKKALGLMQGKTLEERMKIYREVVLPEYNDLTDEEKSIERTAIADIMEVLEKE